MSLIDLKPFSKVDPLHDFPQNEKKCEFMFYVCVVGCACVVHGGFAAIKNQPLHHFCIVTQLSR